MFYHGINREYMYQQFPVLSPRRSVSQKNREQRLDRNHLIEKFGIEPIHLLESSNEYSSARCIRECLSFGDMVLEYTRLPDPLWQLSKHEVGTTVLDVREAEAVYVKTKDQALRQFLASYQINVNHINF